MSWIYKNRKIFVKAILGVFSFLLLAFLLKTYYFKYEIRQAADRGIEYIAKKQLPSGEIQVLYCENKKMESCKFESASVASVWALDALSSGEGKKIKSILKKGSEFIKSQQLDGGYWRYWSKNSTSKVAADYDDTAVASRFLTKQNTEFVNNKKVFEKNSDGLYYTWVEGPEYLKTLEIDPGVNSNIIRYLKDNDPTVCKYINEAIIGEKKSLFYPDRASLYYVVSGAYADGVSCLEESKSYIIEKILEKRADTGSFGNNLEDALSLVTLMNFDYENRDVLSEAVRAMLKKQNKDGSWEVHRLYTSGIIMPIMHFGSNETSTAIAVEALEKYLAY